MFRIRAYTLRIGRRYTMRPPFRLSVKSATKKKSTQMGAFVAFAHVKVNFEECEAFLGAPQTDHEICRNIGGALFAPLGLMCNLNFVEVQHYGLKTAI